MAFTTAAFACSSPLTFSSLYFASLGSYLNTNYVREPIQQWFINTVTTVPEGTDAAIEDVDLDSLFTDMPDFFVDAVAVQKNRHGETHHRRQDENQYQAVDNPKQQTAQFIQLLNSRDFRHHFGN